MINEYEYVFDKFGLNHHEINISLNLISAYISVAKESFKGVYHDYKKDLSLQNDFISVIHCVKGKGKITTTSGEFLLRENQVLFVHYHNCVSFAAADKKWEFFTIWFRSNNLKIQLNKIFDVPIFPTEEETMEKIINLLSTNDYLSCCKANTFAQGVILDILLCIGEEDNSSPYAESMKKIAVYISQNINSNIEVGELATICSISKNHFFNIFKQFFKISPKAYIHREKLKNAAFLLLNTSMPIARIAEELSFYSPAHFSSCFKKIYKATPSEFRHKNNTLLEIEE